MLDKHEDEDPQLDAGTHRMLVRAERPATPALRAWGSEIEGSLRLAGYQASNSLQDWDCKHVLHHPAPLLPPCMLGLELASS